MATHLKSEVIEVNPAAKSWVVRIPAGRKDTARVVVPATDGEETQFWLSIQTDRGQAKKGIATFNARFTLEDGRRRDGTAGSSCNDVVWFNSNDAQMGARATAMVEDALRSQAAVTVRIELISLTDSANKARRDSAEREEAARRERVRVFEASRGATSAASARIETVAVAPSNSEALAPWVARSDVDAALGLVSGEFEADLRQEFNAAARLQFIAGWEVGLHGDEIAADALRELSWHNLGYRLARHFGEAPSSDIELALEVCRRWTARPTPDSGPDGPASPHLVSSGVIEGAPREVIQTVFERNPKLRQQCLLHHGPRCIVCGFEFELAFAGIPRAAGYIHVHHVRPLSEVREAHQVDAVSDLVPLCPNCHAVAHLRKPAFTVAELRAGRAQSDG